MRSVCALAVVVAIGVAAAAPPSPRAHYERGDLAELRRWAAQAAVADLARRLISPDRVDTLTAITAAPASPDGVALLPALADLAGTWDRSLAVPAARAAQAIARATDGDRAIAVDLDDDEVAAAAHAWAAVAGRRDRWSDVRALAVEIVDDLTAARAATADDAAAPDGFAALAGYLGDPDPEVRIAALECVDVPAPATAHAALVDRVINDPDPRVRLVAAQALCAADPEVAVAALGDAGRAALRATVTAGGERPGALLDAARCLAVDDDPRSVRALVALRHQAPRVLRGPLAALWRRRGSP